MFYGNQDNIHFLFWYAFTITDNPEKLKCFPIEFDDEKVLELTNKYDFVEVFESYCKLGKFEDHLSTNNILKNKIKMKKIFDIMKDLKTILENRLSLYFNKNIEADLEDLESFIKIKDFNKVNIMNVLIEEKSVNHFLFFSF